MTKKFLTIAMVFALFVTACKETKQESAEITTSDSVENTVTEDIVTMKSTDKDGKELNIAFNNTQGTATIDFEGETAELTTQKAASGFWYANDTYVLQGKGNDVMLKKDGNLVFEHQDDIVNSSLKNAKGETLDMTFNNTDNTVKVYVNGGDQIELKGERAASGIWYKNDHYELRGKGDNLELTKDGETLFKN